MKPHDFKTVDIKGKQYVEVHERIKYLSEHEDYELSSEYQFIESLNAWLCKATLKIYKTNDDGFKTNDCVRIFTGLAQETIGDGFINKTSALENCETSAVGRACAMAGIGIVDGIASVDEINKAKNTKPRLPELKKDTKQYEDVVKGLAQGYTIAQVEQKYYLTKEIKQLLI